VTARISKIAGRICAVSLVLCGWLLYSQPKTPRAEAKEMSASLTGKWRKLPTADCDAAYPDEIEFFARPRYLGKKGPRQGFITWDAGTYEVTGDNQVKISTATDEQVLYMFSIAGDVLTFVDKNGCEFRYQRAS
jgi:hypothetical protein